MEGHETAALKLQKAHRPDSIFFIRNSTTLKEKVEYFMQVLRWVEGHKTAAQSIDQILSVNPK